MALALCLMLAGCATAPPSDPASLQQAQADPVIDFQSWNSISFIKPDIAGTPGALPGHGRSFSGPAFEKLVFVARLVDGAVIGLLWRDWRVF